MQDDNFEDGLESLLQDYAKPVADNGFSKAVLARAVKEMRLRRYLLWGASLTGGIIASSQLSKLGTLLGAAQVPNASKLSLPSFDLEVLSTIAQQNLSLTIAITVIAALGLWLASEALTRHI